jgi:hypothetical protein
LRIDLLEDKAAFLPGEQIKGSLQWDLESAPEIIRLQLGWKTEGKGNEDSETLATEMISQPPLQGNQEFTFTLPEGPYSFSGKLISVIWYLKASMVPESEEHRIEIVVSPTRQEIILPIGPDES